MSTQGEIQLLKLPRIEDPRGTLSVVEGMNQIPFEIKRVFYLYDVPGGSERAGHALRSCHQLLIAMSGSFDVHLDNGSIKQTYHLNRSYYGLYLPPLTWREMTNFSSGSVCLALASEPYDEAGYYRLHSEFIRAVNTLNKP